MDRIGGDPTTAAEIDQVFELLSTPHRRALVQYFAENPDGGTELDELVEHVLRSELAAAESRERVALELHHRHLPKLADAGVVEYDAGGGVIRYEEEPLLEAGVELVAELRAVV